jgi:hypothetical protein
VKANEDIENETKKRRGSQRLSWMWWHQFCFDPADGKGMSMRRGYPQNRCLNLHTGGYESYLFGKIASQ